MYQFVAGVDPSMDHIAERLNSFIAEARLYEGLMEIRLPVSRPNICVLVFKDKESADVARWMMEINGAEPTIPEGTFDYQEGGAGGERDTEHTDDDNRQPGNGAGGGSTAGGG